MIIYYEFSSWVEKEDEAEEGEGDEEEQRGRTEEERVVGRGREGLG